LQLASAVIVIVAVCHLADFYETVRCFTVGVNAPFNAFATVWRASHPPVPAAVLVVAFTLALTAFALKLSSAAPEPARSDYGDRTPFHIWSLANGALWRRAGCRQARGPHFRRDRAALGTGMQRLEWRLNKRAFAVDTEGHGSPTGT
jgi:hypothetical protein